MEQETANFRDFARRCNCKPSYVTQLRKDGRLVLTEDGKRVLVAESLARIKATADPARVGVKARHAAHRAQAAGQGGAKPAAPAEADSDAQAQPETAAEPPSDPGDEGFQYWRRRSEKAKAIALERENAVAEGKLMDAGEVADAVSGATTALRVRLEALPDTLGPQLAAMTNETEVRAALAESIEHALEECARQFGALAKQVSS